MNSMTVASNWARNRYIFLFGSVLFYLLAWGILRHGLGVVTTCFVFLPVVVAAWFCGALIGVLAGLGGVICNTVFLLLFDVDGGSSYATSSIRVILGLTLVIGAGLIGHLSDVYHRLKDERSHAITAEKKLAESQERFQLLADLAPYPISILDSGGHYIYLNSRFVETFGYTLDDIPTGEDWFCRAYPKIDYREQARRLWVSDVKATTIGEISSREFTVTCKDGTVRDVIFKPISLKDKSQFVVYEDITAHREAEERLQYSTLYDSLTGLANRELLKSHLRQSINRAKRDKKHQFALLFLDLDGFKYVNDSYGHDVGDKLLVSVAQRLNAQTRPTDTVARLGADDFTIVLDDIHNMIDATIVAERILADLKDPFLVEGVEIQASVSIGIVPGSKGYAEAEHLLRDGEIALYRAKTGGTCRYEIFDVEMRENINRRINMENDLRSAIKRQDFAVHYQPIWSLATGKPVGFEALVRWMAERVVSPAEFIPLAEETGLIVPIDHWLISRVCHQAYLWRKEIQTIEEFQFNVNLSGRDFSSQPDLVDVVETTLQATDLNPRCLRFEITESAIMKDIDNVVAILARLRELGIGVDLDDFGTGYSSLSYLQQFPVDGLKIDRSFTMTMSEDKKSLQIVKSIITIAHDLGLQVISEGVETNEQLAILKDLGCDKVQGFLLSRPLDGESTERFIRESA
jgi:diguanylate cyclase (GGDEF)-like protein/PAS domain S-box-containing protein